MSLGHLTKLTPILSLSFRCLTSSLLAYMVSTWSLIFCCSLAPLPPLPPNPFPSLYWCSRGSLPSTTSEGPICDHALRSRGLLPGHLTTGSRLDIRCLHSTSTCRRTRWASLALHHLLELVTAPHFVPFAPLAVQGTHYVELLRLLPQVQHAIRTTSSLQEGKNCLWPHCF